MSPMELKNALLAESNKHSHAFGDEEIHEEMDKLLVKTLRSLGYDEAMDIFDNQKKWYS